MWCCGEDERSCEFRFVSSHCARDVGDSALPSLYMAGKSLLASIASRFLRRQGANVLFLPLNADITATDVVLGTDNNLVKVTHRTPRPSSMASIHPFPYTTGCALLECGANA